MNRLTSFSIKRLSDVYHWRSNLYHLGLNACADSTAAVMISAEFSDIAKYLIATGGSVEGDIDLRCDDQALHVEIRFMPIQPDSEHHHSLFVRAGFLIHEMNGQLSASKTYRLGYEETRHINIDALLKTLQNKSREELFEDLNVKNAQLQVEIEDRKKTEQTLKEAQRDLIENEKLTALGGLVAGIAHEVNTPVGIGVTATSHIRETLDQFTTLYKEGNMKRSDLDGLLVSIKELNGMVESNLQRASNLIRSFKEVAVDQTAEDEREFSLLAYAKQIITSVSPRLRNRNIEISTLGIDPSIVLKTTPGPISQILVNLITNSLVHGFDEHESGTISISAEMNQGSLNLTYRDTGKGIPAENLDKIFDPFFTTKRSHGGSGLGMHLIYNIVTKKYSGKIRCESFPGHGTSFMMILNGVA